MREGLAKEFAGHAGHDASVPDPNDPRTFIRSKLDWQKAASEEGKAWLRFTRHLIQLRHRYIVPLLAAGGAVEGMILHAAAQALAVSWQFSGGTLSVALNIGEERAAMPEIPGEVIFSWPERQEALSPNIIVVRFAHGEASS